MTQKYWLLVLPILLGLGLGGKAVLNPHTAGADQRLMDPDFVALERQTGRHLYAPTWLPYQGRIGKLGSLQGVHRILQDFTDNQERALVMVAQEPRTHERDAYNRRIFQVHAEAKADVNGMAGYYITGSGGERRLFWNTSDTSVILSSCILTDDELLMIARKVK
jgi:hypothetical protein